LTGNSPLLAFNIQQDEERVRIRATGRTSGTGRILKKSSNTKKVEAQAKVEIKKVGSSLNLDLSLPPSLRLTLVSRLTFHGH
jgi:hypothetical protein